MHTLQAITTEIFSRCAALGWSQSELARRAGVARESVSRLRSRSDADFSLLHKLCEALGLQLSANDAQPLRLSFPYDWSNSTMPADSVIAAVLERGIFADVLEVARYYGVARVRQQFNPAQFDLPARTLQRMLGNIESGFAAAHA
jgi:transcriptional regulator with XRE-family HTH domain